MVTLTLQELFEATAVSLAKAAEKPNNLNYNAHEIQEKFHRSEAQGRLYVGGNRSGKSVAGVNEAIWISTGTHPYLPNRQTPTKGRIITVDFLNGANKIILPLLQQWLAPSMLINGSWEDSYDKREHLLTLSNKSQIEIMSHEQPLEAFAGASRDFLWVDEECPSSIFTESKMRLIDRNGCFFITMTPVEGMCVDDLTRLLSKRGWLYHWQVLPDEIILTYNQEIKKTQWLPIEAMYVDEDYEDAVLVNLDKRKQISFKTTPNHKWVTDEGLKVSPVAQDIIIAADHENVSGLPYSDAFCNLIGWVVGDGTIPNDSNTKVIIYQNPGPLSDIINDLLTQVNATYSIMKYEKRNRFQIRGELGRQIRSVLGPKKVLPIEFISGLSQSQLEALSRGLMLSDGTLRDSGSWEYTTVRKDHVEAYSVVGTLLGKRVTVRQYSNYYFKVQFWGESKDQWGSDSRKFRYKATAERYKGTVWCPHTRNGTFVAERNGSIYITGNTWVYNDLFTNPGDDVEVFEADIDDNPYLPAESKKIVLAGLSEEDRKIRGSGKFVAIGGVVLREFDFKRHVVEAINPPLTLPWYVSIDHGYNNPTAVLWHAITPAGHVVTFYEHYRSGWTVDMHCAEIHKINEKLGKEPDRYIGDPAMEQRQAVTGTSILVEYRRNGIPVIKANNDVKPGLDKMNEYLRQDKWFITKDCRHLLTEIPKYRWKKYSSTKLQDALNKREEPQKKDDHAIDSARYQFSFMPRLEPVKQTPKEVNKQAIVEVMKPGTTFNPKRARVYPWQMDQNLRRPNPQPVGWGEIP